MLHGKKGILPISWNFTIWTGKSKLRAQPTRYHYFFVAFTIAMPIANLVTVSPHISAVAEYTENAHIFWCRPETHQYHSIVHGICYTRYAIVQAPTLTASIAAALGIGRL